MAVTPASAAASVDSDIGEIYTQLVAALRDMLRCTGIAILRPQPRPNLTYKLVAQSPLVKLETYFGKTAEFPLETTIPIKKKDVIALTVPSWAPALALGFAGDTSWRASRPRKSCTSTSSQTTHTTVGSPVQYYCLYQTARLTYSATLISTP